MAYLIGAKTDGQVAENYLWSLREMHLEICRKEICTAHHAEYSRNSHKEITKVTQLWKKDRWDPWKPIQDQPPVSAESTAALPSWQMFT